MIIIILLMLLNYMQPPGKGDAHLVLPWLLVYLLLEEKPGILCPETINKGGYPVAPDSTKINSNIQACMQVHVNAPIQSSRLASVLQFNLQDSAGLR